MLSGATLVLAQGSKIFPNPQVSRGKAGPIGPSN